jgi:imidazolonepropionase-like amidohydrolase
MSLTDEVDTPQLTRDEMTALVDEAHRLRKRVAAQCHGDRAAGDAIAAGVDSIEHGTFLRDETLEAMKAKGVYLVPTLLVQDQLGRQLDRLPPELAVKARQPIEAAPAMVRRALEIGVKDGGDDERPEPLCWSIQRFSVPQAGRDSLRTIAFANSSPARTLSATPCPA